MSYNILASNPALKAGAHQHLANKYKTTEYRSVRTIDEIEKSNSDIICLQEVDKFETVYRPALES